MTADDWSSGHGSEFLKSQILNIVKPIKFTLKFANNTNTHHYTLPKPAMCSRLEDCATRCTINKNTHLNHVAKFFSKHCLFTQHGWISVQLFFSFKLCFSLHQLLREMSHCFLVRQFSVGHCWQWWPELNWVNKYSKKNIPLTFFCHLSHHTQRLLFNFQNLSGVHKYSIT